MNDVLVQIVSDVRLYREGLARVLEGHYGLKVTAVASDAAQALATLADGVPDVALVDVAARDGLAAIRALNGAAPAIRIVALAVPESDGDVVACVEAGVSGIVSRDDSLDDLHTAIRSAARGGAPCSAVATASLLRRVRAVAAERSAAEADLNLTAREIQIVRLIDEGLSNKEIAQRLCIGVPTVKNHVHHVLEKLNVRRRGEAAARLRAALAVRGAPNPWRAAG